MFGDIRPIVKTPTMIAPDDRLLAELRGLDLKLINAVDDGIDALHSFLSEWTSLRLRLTALAQAGSLSEEVARHATHMSSRLASVTASLVRLETSAQQAVPAITEEARRIVEEYRSEEDEDEFDYCNGGDYNEGPDTNWETLRDWFLANLAYPFPTPSQSRRLAKECHIESDELESWLERIRELTHWDELYSAWAQGDQSLMKQLMKLAQKEIDLGIPEHRCRTSSIQRSELERLRRLVHEIYKPGPSEWWVDIESLLDGSSSEDDDSCSGDEHIWPSSDEEDTQELAVVDPSYGLDTFFDAVETSTTTPIRPSISSPIPATISITSKGTPAPPLTSALQRESLEWLDKLDRVEAEKNAAYAEVERIAMKLEGGGYETVAIKLEAAEIRFEAAREKEEEVAIAALQRVQALRAQIKREGSAVGQASEAVVKEEYVEAVVPINDTPTVEPEALEECVPVTKFEVETALEVSDSVHSPCTVKTKSEMDTGPKPPKSEPSDVVKIEIKAESRTELDAIKTDPDANVEAKEGPDVKVKSELQFALNFDQDAAEAKSEVKKTNVKLEIQNEPPSPPISPKSEPETIVFGTFQLPEPEETQDLIASFAPLEVTFIQLDPDVIIVPPGLINLFKSNSCTQDEFGEEPEVIVKVEPREISLSDEYVHLFFFFFLFLEFLALTHQYFCRLVNVPISFSLKEVVSPLSSSSMFPQVQIVLDPSTTPASPASRSPIPPIVPATPRRTRGHPRRTSPRLAAQPHTPPRFASVSSTSSVSGYYSGSSACSSDSEFGDSTIPTSSPVTERSRPLPQLRRTKASPPQLSPTSPSQRKRKRGREEEPSPYDRSNPSASRPLKRLRGFKRDQHEEEGAHAVLCADFVPPPLPKVSMVSESRKTKRKRREEEEEELRVIKRARVLCHVNAMQEDSLERPCHSIAALVLNPALASQPSPKLEKVSGLPVVVSTPITLEAIEEKLRVAVEDGPHPIVEEIKNLSLEALALMTDLEFSALICSPESWELRCLEYEPNEDLFEDSPTPHPEPTKILLALPSPPMSAVVALPPAEDIARGAPSEVEKLVETTSTAPAEIVVKQEPIEPVLGLALAPVLPSTIETVPERIHDVPSIAASATDANRGDRCGTPLLMDDSLSTRPRSPKPTPAPLVRRTRTKRAVGMMDILSLSGERVSPTLKDASDLFKYEAEEEDWKMEREPYSFPARPYKNDGRRVPRGRKSEGSWVPFMDYRQSVRYHPDDGG